MLLCSVLLNDYSVISHFIWILARLVIIVNIVLLFLEYLFSFSLSI